MSQTPAERAKAWRDRQRADAETDASIVRGLMQAARGYLRDDGRPMMQESEPRIRDVCSAAMADLARTAGIPVPVAIERVTARLAAALDGP